MSISALIQVHRHRFTILLILKLIRTSDTTPSSPKLSRACAGINTCIHFFCKYMQIEPKQVEYSYECFLFYRALYNLFVDL